MSLLRWQVQGLGVRLKGQPKCRHLMLLVSIAFPGLTFLMWTACRCFVFLVVTMQQQEVQRPGFWSQLVV
jgi:hypothetical protein